jgi:hypothetical protein
VVESLPSPEFNPSTTKKKKKKKKQLLPNVVTLTDKFQYKHKFWGKQTFINLNYILEI